MLPIITSYRLDPNVKSTIPDWVYLCLVQARFHNPDTPIYLITDQVDFPAIEHLPLLKTINFIDASSLLASEEVKHFHNVYFPVSINPFFYERTCIERWFLIREFAKQNKIDKFFHMDTDVMLFCDITENSSIYKGYDLTTLGFGSFGTAHFFNPLVLEDFCKMVIEFYERRTYVYQRGAYLAGLLNPDRPVDNISDMFFVNLFIQEYKKSFDAKITCCDDPKYGGVFDCHMNNDSPGVEMEGDYKKIYWFEGVPFSRYKNSDYYLRLFCLHFQGGAKGLIPEFFDYALKQLSIHDVEKINRFLI